MSEPSESHYDTILRATAEGRVMPLLGAGVNLCGRPKDVAWQHGRYLPSGAELASHLAGLFGYPEGELLDLLRVSQYVEVTLGSGPLYDKLHELFDADSRRAGCTSCWPAFPGGSGWPSGAATS